MIRLNKNNISTNMFESLTLLVASSFILVGCDGEKSLILVHVVARHGQRAPDPAVSYPNDIYKNETYLPYGPGRLTPLGRQQAKNVAGYLRKRYDDFLGPNPKIDATTSARNRTRQSAEIMLRALHGGTTNFTYKVIPGDKDTLLDAMPTCRAMNDIDFTRNGTFCKHGHRVRQLVRKHSGLNVTKPSHLYSVRDTINSQVEMGFKVPEWVAPIWPEPLSKCTMEQWYLLVSNRTWVSWIAGNLFNKILNDTQTSMEQGSQRKPKMFLYSAHDLNINGLLAILGNFKCEYTSYASFLLFEVHKIGTRTGFKVYYERYSAEEPVLLAVPGCGSFCSLEDLMKLGKLYRPQDWCPY